MKDGLIEPSDVEPLLRELARRINESGQSAGIRVSDWINDAVKAKLPFADLSDWQELLHEGDVTVFVAAPRMLLAMKLLANRGRRDTDDIHFLLDSCQVTSLDEAQEIYETYNHQEVLSVSARARVEEWLARRYP